jgi:hypothetical protein
VLYSYCEILALIGAVFESMPQPRVRRIARQAAAMLAGEFGKSHADAEFT